MIDNNTNSDQIINKNNNLKRKNSEELQEEVFVIKNSAILYEKVHEEEGKEIELITRNAFYKRRKVAAGAVRRPESKVIKVVKGTDILFDDAIHQKEDKEFEFISRDAFHKRQKVTVLSGTETRYDPAIHKSNEKIETISLSALQNRKEKYKKCKVLKKDGTRYDPENSLHQGQEIEEITEQAFRKRARKRPDPEPKAIKVVKGTDILFDDSIHQKEGKESELITKGTFRRRQKVTVLLGTSTLFDPAIHKSNEETEEIAVSALYNRKNYREANSKEKRKSKTIKVVKGTATLFDDTVHQEEGELITKSAFRKRALRRVRRPELKVIKVVKGTDILFDDAIHQKEGTEFELITKAAFHKRQKVTVLLGTTTLHDPAIHKSNEKTEEISLSKLYDRKAKEKRKEERVAKLIKVVKGTGVLFDDSVHQGEGEEPEFISRDTFHKRQKVTVLSGTTTRYDPAIHKSNKKIEEISVSKLSNRKGKEKKKGKLIKVVKGTATLFDDTIHQKESRELELITISAFRDRQKVTVLSGTTTLYDPAIHKSNEKIEEIATSTFRKRKGKEKKREEEEDSPSSPSDLISVNSSSSQAIDKTSSERVSYDDRDREKTCFIDKNSFHLLTVENYNKLSFEKKRDLKNIYLEIITFINQKLKTSQFNGATRVQIQKEKGIWGFDRNIHKNKFELFEQFILEISSKKSDDNLDLIEMIISDLIKFWRLYTSERNACPFILKEYSYLLEENFKEINNCKNLLTEHLISDSKFLTIFTKGFLDIKIRELRFRVKNLEKCLDAQENLAEDVIRRPLFFIDQATLSLQIFPLMSLYTKAGSLISIYKDHESEARKLIKKIIPSNLIIKEKDQSFIVDNQSINHLKNAISDEKNLSSFTILSLLKLNEQFEEESEKLNVIENNILEFNDADEQKKPESSHINTHLALDDEGDLDLFWRNSGLRLVDKIEEKILKFEFKSNKEKPLSWPVIDQVSLADSGPIYQSTLKPYQKESHSRVEQLAELGLTSLLALEMGTGKTLIIAEGIIQYIAKGGKGDFLIVNPVSTFKQSKQAIKLRVAKARFECFLGSVRKLDQFNKEEETERLKVIFNFIQTHSPLIKDEDSVHHPRKRERIKESLCLFVSFPHGKMKDVGYVKAMCDPESLKKLWEIALSDLKTWKNLTPKVLETFIKRFFNELVDIRFAYSDPSQEKEGELIATILEKLKSPFEEEDFKGCLDCLLSIFSGGSTLLSLFL